MEYSYCLRCGRKLTNEENKKLGYGKICYEKMQHHSIKPLFLKEMDISERISSKEL